jgi:uncharacterized membrane protein (DUF441 family)
MEIEPRSGDEGRRAAPATFVSYSRRQLYFAEALVLHLQAHGLDVWFDLQQLQAGVVWSDDLESGVLEAARLILIVSQASLESPYTREEWKTVVDRGDSVVLVLFEPIDLPEELRGLPTYDFRSGFDRNLLDLVAFLKGAAEPRQDRIAAANRLGLSARLPGVIWLMLAAQFGCFVACILSLLVAVILTPSTAKPSDAYFWCVTAFTFFVGARYAVPFLHHTLEYKKVKRSAVVNLLLLIPALLAIGMMGNVALWSDNRSKLAVTSYLYLSIVFGTALLVLFVYLYTLRRSGGLLRWMRPEDALQKLRRRVHQPLAPQATFEPASGAGRKSEPVRYALHADAADRPFEQYVESTFEKEGHRRASEDEAPQHHVAILSNRSSEAWAHALAEAYPGKLVFVVASTIEFTERLKEIGRYQWVDARDMDRREIAALVRSLGDEEAWKREAALETTPAMIDRWKVPTEITVLKRVLEWFGIYVLVFGLTDLIGAAMKSLGLIESTAGDGVRSSWLVLVGGVCFWLAGRGLVYRKVPGPVLYGLLVGTIGVVSVHGRVVMRFLESVWWLPGALLLLVVLSSWLGARAWLPAFGEAHRDEIGIKQSIDRAFRRKRIGVVIASVLAIVGMVVAMLIGSGPSV